MAGQDRNSSWVQYARQSSHKSGKQYSGWFTKFAKDNYEAYRAPKQVEDEVKRVMEVLGRDGGCVFAPGHNIQALVPAENIDAMLNAAAKYR